MKQNDTILESYKHLTTLKKIKRTGWLRSGVPRDLCESVAEHSFGTALLGYLLAREFYPELSAEKVLLLGLIHDLGEAVTGDVLPWDKDAIPDFDAKERTGALQAAAGLKALPALTTLYDEYYDGLTPEAKLVRQIDKIEMLLQAVCYERELGVDLQQFFENKENVVFDGELQPLLDAMQTWRKG